MLQFEIGKYVKELSSEHTKEEIEEIKEKGEEIPEDWYVDKWVRYYMDQKSRPMTVSSMAAGQSKMPENESIKESINAAVEEVKSVQSKRSKESKVEPSVSVQQPATIAASTVIHPEPCEEMFAYATSVSGLVELKDIYFKCDSMFKAGNYTMIIRDVTKGLPPRKKTKNIKVLLKIVNMDPEEAVATIPTSQDGKGKGKKK